MMTALRTFLKEPSMRQSYGISLASLVVVVVCAIALPELAAARIQCQDNFQVTKYGPIATPYCDRPIEPEVCAARGQHCHLRSGPGQHLGNLYPALQCCPMHVDAWKKIKVLAEK